MNALTIAGSDPSGGAGIQRDMLVFERLGLYGLSVVTAVTSQNTGKFYGAEPVSAKAVSEQIGAVLDDFDVSAIKIGMVYTSSVIRAVQKRLKDVRCPIIVDPVVRSTTGGTLLSSGALEAFRNHIVPLAYAITPNAYECGVVSGRARRGVSGIASAASAITKMGARNVIVTGVPSGNSVTDYVFGEKEFSISHRKVSVQNHGGGCTFSSALAGHMAAGYGFAESVRKSASFAGKFVRDARKIGRGLAVASPGRRNTLSDDLASAISEMAGLSGAYKSVPECQTNFVYAKPNPKSVRDVFGVQGRIVRTGKKITVCGAITLGGSKHVASAVVEMCGRFPSVRSAMNVRYDATVVKRMSGANMRVSSYDRALEPARIKNSHRGTVRWGVREATKGSKIPPDAIYHAGDHGKEPMILIFGKTPLDVLHKFARIRFP